MLHPQIRCCKTFAIALSLTIMLSWFPMCYDSEMNSMTIRKNYFIIRFAKLKMLYDRVATRKMKKIFSIENGNIYGNFKQFNPQWKEEIYKNITRTSGLFQHVSNWTLFIVAELS